MGTNESHVFKKMLQFYPERTPKERSLKSLPSSRAAAESQAESPKKSTSTTLVSQYEGYSEKMSTLKSGAVPVDKTIAEQSLVENQKVGVSTSTKIPRGKNTDAQSEVTSEYFPQPPPKPPPVDSTDSGHHAEAKACGEEHKNPKTGKQDAGVSPPAVCRDKPCRRNGHCHWGQKPLFGQERRKREQEAKDYRKGLGNGTEGKGSGAVKPGSPNKPAGIKRNYWCRHLFTINCDICTSGGKHNHGKPDSFELLKDLELERLPPVLDFESDSPYVDEAIERHEAAVSSDRPPTQAELQRLCADVQAAHNKDKQLPPSTSSSSHEKREDTKMEPAPIKNADVPALTENKGSTPNTNITSLIAFVNRPVEVAPPPGLKQAPKTLPRPITAATPSQLPTAAPCSSAAPAPSAPSNPRAEENTNQSAPPTASSTPHYGWLKPPEGGPRPAPHATDYHCSDGTVISGTACAPKDYVCFDGTVIPGDNEPTSAPKDYVCSDGTVIPGATPRPKPPPPSTKPQVEVKPPPPSTKPSVKVTSVAKPAVAALAPPVLAVPPAAPAAPPLITPPVIPPPHIAVEQELADAALLATRMKLALMASESKWTATHEVALFVDVQGTTHVGKMTCGKKFKNFLLHTIMCCCCGKSKVKMRRNAVDVKKKSDDKTKFTKSKSLSVKFCCCFKSRVAEAPLKHYHNFEYENSRKAEVYTEMYEFIHTHPKMYGRRGLDGTGAVMSSLEQFMEKLIATEHPDELKFMLDRPDVYTDTLVHCVNQFRIRAINVRSSLTNTPTFRMPPTSDCSLLTKNGFLLQERERR